MKTRHVEQYAATVNEIRQALAHLQGFVAMLPAPNESGTGVQGVTPAHLACLDRIHEALTDATEEVEAWNEGAL